MVGQIAVSMVLLTGAALLLKSFRNTEEQNLGMQTGGVFTAQIALPGFRYNTTQETDAVLSRRGSGDPAFAGHSRGRIQRFGSAGGLAGRFALD